MNITVSAAPPILSTITNTVSSILMNWSGGIAPYQAQMSTNLATSSWDNVGGLISLNTFIIALTHPAAFYRIMGQ